MDGSQSLIEESRNIWDANAEAWDEMIGKGGGLQTRLIAPTVEKMLDIRPGEMVLDIACGNGIFSRRLSQLGAYVVASDFSPKLVKRAKATESEYNSRIEYSVVDATDEAHLLAMAGDEGRRFDAAVCLNAIMDMPAIEPLYRAVAQMLKPGGRFVFSVMHPAFNGQSITMMPELPDYAMEPTYSVKISSYLSNRMTRGLAIATQPQEQYYWHRPLHLLLNAAFENGLVCDRIEEPPLVLDADSKPGPFSWANYDMPPLFFARLRPKS